MTKELEQAIFLACLEAFEAMGEKAYGMSCFAANWTAAEDEVEPERLAA